MNNDQIIEIAKQSNIPHWEGTDQPEFLADLCDFARLIAAAQREEDARICEVERENYCAYPRTQGWYGADNCAAAIRNSGGAA